MNRPEVRKQILKLISKETVKVFRENLKKYNLKNYHFMSANILKLMPHIKLTDHKKIYKQLQNIKYLESSKLFFKTIDLDLFFQNLNPNTFCKELPSIYVSFHIGAYRTLILAMVKYNVDIAIIIDTSIYPLSKIEEELNNHFLFAKDFFPSSTSKFKIISANNRNTIIELMRILNHGFSILTYVDWNSGYNNDKSNNIEVTFLDNRLSVRQSLAYLSYYVRVPIIPCVSYYDENYQPVWQILNTIYPKEYKNAEEYSHYAMQTLYSYLEKIVNEHFSQWRGWFHIHKSIVFEEDTINLNLNEFNPNLNYNLALHTGIFTIADTHFIMNKKSYRIIKLPNSVFEKLISNSILSKLEVDLVILNQLYQTNMLESVK